VFDFAKGSVKFIKGGRYPSCHSVLVNDQMRAVIDASSNLEETIFPLQRLKTFDVDTYLTSHGKGIYEGDPSHIDRYLDVISIRDQQIADLLKKGPRTLHQIVKEGIIYGNKTTPIGPWDLNLSEKYMMMKHLDRLLRMGEVQNEGQFYILSN
jgi:hypothetical protein